MKNPTIPNTYLYFGNLTYDATEETIRNTLSPVAEVKSVTMAVDSATGRSLGYAFVELGSKEEVEKAITELNGKEILGKACYLDLPANQADLWERVYGGSDR